MEEKEKRILSVFCIVILLTVSAGATINSISDPIANAGSDRVVDINTILTFSATGSTTGADSYEWLFRDDTPNGIGYTVTHTFVKEGIYEVGLVVTNGGKSALDIARITVKNFYPVAVASHECLAWEDESIAFDATSSTDQNGQNEIADYLWDFGDGVTSSLSSTTHSYSKQGVYYIALTVTDHEGAADRNITQITIQNMPPLADAGPDRIVNEDDVIDFDASGSMDTTSDQHSLTYFWDFGDGNTGNGVSISHTYTKEGMYSAQLKVTDDDGDFDIDVASITVANMVPSANAGSDQTAQEGDTVIFDGTGTFDTPTDKTMLDYFWSFDGKGIHPTYSWQDNGQNEITLTVTDDDATADQDSIIAAVMNVAPSVGINALSLADSTLINFTLRSAGEKWRNVQFYLYEDNTLIRKLEVYRVPGSPDTQTDTCYGVVLGFGQSYNVSVYFTPADDPINGQYQGDSPSWIILGLEDGREFWIQHNFNVNQPETFRWDVDFSSIVKLAPSVTALDRGSDDLTLNWDFDDEQSLIVSHFFANNNRYPMDIVDTAVHVYVWPGTYSITLTAIDDDGGSSSHTVQLLNQPSSVTLDNCAPIAEAGLNVTTSEDYVVFLMGSAIDDPADVLSYHWNFGDNSNSTGTSVSHVYHYAGAYLVILTVTDENGAIDQDFLFISINNVAPIANSGIDQSMNEDDLVLFDGMDSYDTPFDKAILTYHWDFGDGANGNGISTSHVYTKVGTYLVTLLVADDNGAIDSDTLIISVSNAAPTANAGLDQSANEDQVVFFSGTATDTPTDYQILSYSWNFGDGANGFGKNPTHSYVNADTYSVILTITDDNGAIATSSIQVSIFNVQPVAFSSGYIGTEKRIWGMAMGFQFDGKAFDTYSDQTMLSYAWDFGDGSGTQIANPIHTYQSSGTYTAILTVQDDEGSSATSSFMINVILDSDGDILRDEDERILHGTDPFRYDTDGDWLTDYREITEVVDSQGRKTDPTKGDTDYDGLNDWEERYPGEDEYITDPFDSDTDDDSLIDSQEMFTKSFKTRDRFNLEEYISNSAGITSITLSNVIAFVPDPDLIYKVDAKIGITHDNISNLQISISKDGNNYYELKSWDSVAVGAPSYFTNFDLLDSSRFPNYFRSDFTSSKTWTLRIIDFKPTQTGSLEYFEIHITARTNPNAWSSDGDSLNDSEEINLGRDGWYTEPWKTDTDNDGWSDSDEVITKGTDPTRADTDRDGYNDNVDKDPLRDLMIQIKIEYFTAFESDPELGGDEYPEPFVGIEYGDKWIFTPGKEPSSYQAYFGNYYTLDVPDNQNSVIVKMHAYENDWWEDKEWNINHGQNKHHTVTYAILGDAHSFYTRGGYPGNSHDDNEKWNASLSFRIDTIQPERINTILLNSTKGESLCLTPTGTWICSNQWRYFGEDEYYVAILNAKSAYNDFVLGYNAIIIPRSVFLDSKLNYTLRTSSSDNLQSYLKQLEFGTYNDSRTITTGAIISTFTGEVWGSEANSILNLLEMNKDNVPIAQSRVITSQLPTINIDDDVIELIPITGLKFDEIGDPPDSLLGKIVKFVIDIATFVWNGLVTIGNFLADLGKAILEWGIMILGAIVEFFSAVVNAVVKAFEVLIDFIGWILEFVTNLIQTAVDSFILSLNNLILDTISKLGNALEVSADYYLQNGNLDQATIASINSAFLSNFFWICVGMATAIVVIMTILGYIPLVGLILGILCPLIIVCILVALGGQQGYDQTPITIPEASSGSPKNIGLFMLSHMANNAPSSYYGPNELETLSQILAAASFGLIEIYVATLSSFIAELLLILTIAMIIGTLMIAIKLYGGGTNLSNRAISMLSLFGAIISGLSIIAALASMVAAATRLSPTQFGLAIAAQIAGFISIGLYIVSIP